VDDLARRAARAAAAGLEAVPLELQQREARDRPQHLAWLLDHADAAAESSVPARPSPEAPATASPRIPPEVLAAVQQGDVAELAGLLRSEHEKRSPPAAAAGEAPRPGPPTVPSSTGRPGIDAAMIDELVRIAADSDVTVEWLVFRAVKRYVEEHRRTGIL
jgi:hypothetical protein